MPQVLNDLDLDPVAGERATGQSQSQGQLSLADDSSPPVSHFTAGSGPSPVATTTTPAPAYRGGSQTLSNWKRELAARLAWRQKLLDERATLAGLGQVDIGFLSGGPSRLVELDSPPEDDLAELDELMKDPQVAAAVTGSRPPSANANNLNTFPGNSNNSTAGRGLAHAQEGATSLTGNSGNSDGDNNGVAVGVLTALVQNGQVRTGALSWPGRGVGWLLRRPGVAWASVVILLGLGVLFALMSVTALTNPLEEIPITPQPAQATTTAEARATGQVIRASTATAQVAARASMEAGSAQVALATANARLTSLAIAPPTPTSVPPRPPTTTPLISIVPTTAPAPTPAPPQTTPPPAVPVSVNDEPHQGFIAPSRLAIPAMGISLDRVVKAQSTNATSSTTQAANSVAGCTVGGSGNSTISSSPNNGSTNVGLVGVPCKGVVYHWGAFPGEPGGNVVLVADYETLGKYLIELQQNDQVQVTNRTGSVFTYQLLSHSRLQRKLTPPGQGQGSQITTMSSSAFLTPTPTGDNGNGVYATATALAARYWDEEQLLQETTFDDLRMVQFPGLTPNSPGIVTLVSLPRPGDGGAGGGGAMAARRLVVRGILTYANPAKIALPGTPVGVGSNLVTTPPPASGSGNGAPSATTPSLVLTIAPATPR